MKDLKRLIEAVKIVIRRELEKRDDNCKHRRDNFYTEKSANAVDHERYNTVINVFKWLFGLLTTLVVGIIVAMLTGKK